jgi:hypothetical protein
MGKDKKRDDDDEVSDASETEDSEVEESGSESDDDDDEKKIKTNQITRHAKLKLNALIVKKRMLSYCDSMGAGKPKLREHPYVYMASILEDVIKTLYESACRNAVNKSKMGMLIVSERAVGLAIKNDRRLRAALEGYMYYYNSETDYVSTSIVTKDDIESVIVGIEDSDSYEFADLGKNLFTYMVNSLFNKLMHDAILFKNYIKKQTTVLNTRTIEFAIDVQSCPKLFDTIKETAAAKVKKVVAIDVKRRDEQARKAEKNGKSKDKSKKKDKSKDKKKKSDKSKKKKSS